MILTDFKIALRNILHNKVQSAISILGLGIGLGSIIVLMALIIHEKSFDRFIPDHSNVYKIIFGNYPGTQYPLAEEMKKDFPEIKDFFRIMQANIVQVRNPKGNEYGRNQEFAFSDTSIYRILGIRIIAGTPANSINEVAISEKTAKKFFGSRTALGQILKVKLNNEFIPLNVSGVYKDFPANSTLYPDFLADIHLSETLFGSAVTAYGEYGKGISTALNWNRPAFYSYVILDKNADTKALIAKMQKYRELITEPFYKDWEYHLQSATEIYLGSDRYLEGYRFFRAADSNELKYYWSIAFLILLISVTNYIFLTRAVTSDRLRELGARKVLGASTKTLRGQIIVESNLITIMSLVPASFVIDPGMKLINSALNKTLSYEIFSNPLMLLFLFSTVILIGTFSGLLIGHNISRIPAMALLSGNSSEKFGSKRWDHSFLLFHFSIYIILVVSVITVAKQVRYSMTSYQGINADKILVSELNSPRLKAGFTTICSEISQVPGVNKIAGSSFIPLFTPYAPITLANQEGERVRFEGLVIGEGMAEMLGMELIEGSTFGPYQTSDIEVLFNETSAKKYNIKTGDKYMGAFRVRGIVRDFNSHSLHTPIEPMVILQQNPAKMGYLAIKTDGTNDKEIIKRLGEIYNQIDPDEILDARYITEQMKYFYSHEKNQADIMGAFSILATVLAIMGLFGIALISIARKTREIGLRKVHGASVFEVLYMLDKEFLGWVLMSIIIGIPISYYIMLHWQKQFAYKSGLSWWIFVLAGISAILIALITVSFQSWRAATRNPVEALRHE